MALSGALHLFPNGALFSGTDMVNEPHRHFTSSILVGLEEPILVKTEATGEDWVPYDGVVVAPNVEQQLDARGKGVATLQVDPEGDEFSRIANVFREGPVYVLPPDGVKALRTALAAMTESARSAFQVWSLAIDELAKHGEPRRPLDARIVKVLAIIKEDFLSPPPAGKLAAAVGLSAGRLIHLFTREMGLPIRRYILWLRLRDVLISAVAGSTLTEAAHHAGFSDSAHLSRTFRGMFGFPPSAIVQGGRVKLSYDLETSLAQNSPHRLLEVERFTRDRPGTTPR